MAHGRRERDMGITVQEASESAAARAAAAQEACAITESVVATAKSRLGAAHADLRRCQCRLLGTTFNAPPWAAAVAVGSIFAFVLGAAAILVLPGPAGPLLGIALGYLFAG